MTVKRAREILMDATEGPWLQDKDDPQVVYGKHQTAYRDAVCECICYDSEPEADECENDARAIVLMRNTYEALLDVVEAAKKHIDLDRSFDPAPEKVVLKMEVREDLEQALARAEAAGAHARLNKLHSV